MLKTETWYRWKKWDYPICPLCKRSSILFKPYKREVLRIYNLKISDDEVPAVGRCAWGCEVNAVIPACWLGTKLSDPNGILAKEFEIKLKSAIDSKLKRKALCPHANNPNNLAHIIQRTDYVTYCKVCGKELGRFPYPKRRLGLSLGPSMHPLPSDKNVQKWAERKKLKKKLH